MHAGGTGGRLSTITHATTSAPLGFRPHLASTFFEIFRVLATVKFAAAATVGTRLSLVIGAVRGWQPVNQNQQGQLSFRPGHRRLILCLLLMGTHIGLGIVYAGSSSAPLRISATVARSCRFSTAPSSAVSNSGYNAILDINCLYQSSSSRTPISKEISPAKPQPISMTTNPQGGPVGGYADYVVLDVNF